MPRRPAAFCLLLLFVLLLVPAGCKRKKRAAAVEQPFAASMISASDPRAAVQFRKGFYAVEANAWRWTSKEFEVALSPPARVSEKGAQLLLRFALPDIVIQNLHSVTLSAMLGDLRLQSQAYDKAGANTYTRDIPSDRLSGDMVLIDFSLDKSLPPTSSDARELGIVVSQVGLVAK